MDRFSKHKLLRNNKSNGGVRLLRVFLNTRNATIAFGKTNFANLPSKNTFGVQRIMRFLFASTIGSFSTD